MLIVRGSILMFLLVLFVLLYANTSIYRIVDFFFLIFQLIEACVVAQINQNLTPKI